jgi:glycosyltransferase involved in cell wall biosynthesis
MNMNEPLVSVVTPVYNGETYLAECIESVLAQTYSNWDYLILNNCSTDGTLGIAEEYARRDKRIRIQSNETLLPIIANHNKAFNLISPASKYCKVVSADDWLFPECLTRMVDLAEANPSVGIVGSYQLSGRGSDGRDWNIRYDGLPYPSTVVPGREIVRQHMLGAPYVLGAPTSVLYRSDLIRGQDCFYPNSTAEADTSACCKYLLETDFGFVHQVLSYERVHLVRISTKSHNLNAYLSSRISDVLEYGPRCLSPEEHKRCLEESMREYYLFLASSALKLREPKFWAFHKERLETLGHPFSVIELSKAICIKVCDLLLNPKRTIEIVRRQNT